MHLAFLTNTHSPLSSFTHLVRTRENVEQQSKPVLNNFCKNNMKFNGKNNYINKLNNFQNSNNTQHNQNNKAFKPNNHLLFF